MKTIENIIILGISTLLIYSCDTNKLDVVKTYAEDAIVAPVFNTMSDVVVNQANYDGNGDVTFSWKPADFGCKAAVDYAVYMSSSSKSDVCIGSGINATQYAIDYQSLYNRLVGKSYLALPKGKSSTVKCYVTASIGTDYTTVKSLESEITFEVGRISNGIDMLYISGDYDNDSADEHGIESQNNNHIYAGFVDMHNSTMENTSYRFVDYTYASSLAGNWYGGSLDALTLDGDKLSTTTGLKYISVNLTTNKASIINFTKVGLTGFNGSWGTPAIEMTYNESTKDYTVTAEYTSGNFRVLCYSPDAGLWGGWNYTMGPKTIPELTLQDGSDVKVYHASISKPLVGGDPNMKINEYGKYTFRFYYESADATWHLSVKKAV